MSVSPLWEDGPGRNRRRSATVRPVSPAVTGRTPMGMAACHTPFVASHVVAPTQAKLRMNVKEIPMISRSDWWVTKLKPR